MSQCGLQKQLSLITISEYKVAAATVPRRDFDP
jgi:hypothetical protein